jgi:hypothetical protein
MKRFMVFNTFICSLFALAVASKASLLLFLASFMGSFAVAAFFLFCAGTCGVLFHTMTVMLLSKLNLECTTIIDEIGIRDKLGPVRLNYKWHQIREVEIKDGNVYVVALVNGMHIPASAFADQSEAEDFFALAKRYQTEAHPKNKNQIAAAPESNIPDPDILIRTLHAEEEAKWAEIERIHKEQNRE